MSGYSESLGPRFESWRAHHYSVACSLDTVCHYPRAFALCATRWWFESWRAHHFLAIEKKLRQLYHVLDVVEPSAPVVEFRPQIVGRFFLVAKQ